MRKWTLIAGSLLYVWLLVGCEKPPCSCLPPKQEKQQTLALANKSGAPHSLIAK